jgi:MFS family permease
MFVLTIFLLRESYHPVVLQRKTERLRRETGNTELRSKLDSGLTTKTIFWHTIKRPTKMLFLSPIVFLLSLYMAIVYGYLYLLFTTITSVYEQEYHWSGGIAGLSFLGIGVGMFLGLFAFAATSDRMVARLMAKNKSERKPEYRLPVLMVGALFVPIGLFWYGWSAEKRLHYVMPIIGTGWVGAGLILSFMPISTYLVDAFTMHAASAMAANTVLRSLVGAFLPLAGPSMYQTLGLGWGNSLLGFIALALWPVSLIFYKYGERIRTSKRFEVQW